MYSTKSYAEAIRALIDNKTNRFNVGQMKVIKQAIDANVDPYLIAFDRFDSKDMEVLLYTLKGDEYPERVSPDYRRYNYLLAVTLEKSYSEFVGMEEIIRTANMYDENTLWRDGVYESILDKLNAVGINWMTFIQLVKFRDTPMTPIYALIDKRMPDTNYVYALSFATNAYVGRGAVVQCDDTWNSVIAEYYVKALNDDVPLGLLEQCMKSRNASKIEYVRRAWVKGVDLSEYIEFYTPYELEAITEFLYNGITPDRYLDVGLSPAQLSIIVSGLKKGLDVDLIVNPSFDIVKMSYLLKLLELGKDITKYISEEYTWKELKTITEELI